LLTYSQLQHLYNVAQDISDTQVQELQVKVNALPIEIQKLEDDLGQDFDKQIQLETDLSESQDIVRHQLAEGVLLDSQENDDTDKVSIKLKKYIMHGLRMIFKRICVNTSNRLN